MLSILMGGWTTVQAFTVKIRSFFDKDFKMPLLM